VKPIDHRGSFLIVLSTVIVLAWAALWLWEQSPYGRYLGHDYLGVIGLTTPARELLLVAAAYVLGWLLMTIAMMLPTTVPLLEIFRRLTRRRDDRRTLVMLLVAGYVGVWLLFGMVAHVFDLFLHRLFDRSAWLQANAWVFGAGPLLLAGAFQFSSLKYRCLDECRNPLSFVVRHWRAQQPRRESFMLGASHGAFCVGCCWALMLLMFAVGMGNVGWMLVLAAIMAVEKNLPWGRHLSAPVGIGLFAWGAAIVIDQSWSWQTWGAGP
jgi:predicted metal-binding membrane protein